MPNEEQLMKYGFAFGKGGPHSARSMMLKELKFLLFSRDENATQSDYKSDIIDFNILHKSTETTRKLTYQFLVRMYALDTHVPLFKVFRQWWDLREDAQNILALQLAMTRDTILRSSADVILQLEPGEAATKDIMESFLAADDPDRYSQSSLQSITRNLYSTWAQAGYLTGRSKKYREIPKVDCVNVAYALFLGHCHGLSGQQLFDSFWCRILDQDKERLYDLAYQASLKGLINFKQASEVVEVTFPAIDMLEV